jgi:hypothetical protein
MGTSKKYKSPILKWIRAVHAGRQKKEKKNLFAQPAKDQGSLCPYSVEELELYLGVIQEKLKRILYFGKPRSTLLYMVKAEEEYTLEQMGIHKDPNSNEEGGVFIIPEMLFSAPIDTYQDMIKAKLMQEIIVKEKMISLVLYGDR